MTTTAPGGLDTCAAASGGGSVPLVALLGRLEAAFVEEFDRRLADSEFGALSLAHSRNVLRHLGAGPMRACQLVSIGDVSKQAISQQVAYLETNGYLTTSVDPTDSRARVVALTATGERAQQVVKTLFEAIEADWADEVGARDFAALRRVLGHLVEVTPRPRSCG